MDYYVFKNNQNIGPISEVELTARLRSGEFSLNDLGCRVGESEWQELGLLIPLLTSSPTVSVYPAQRSPYPPPAVYRPNVQAPSGNSSDIGKLLMYEANKKSTGVAYVLWFFLGLFGAHRFYIGETGTGAAMLIITLCSIVLKFVLIGFLTIFITIIWWFVDLFLIPSLVSRRNNQLAARLNS